MKIAIYPGSFDPVTKGHLDILKNAAGIFDKVIIAVAHNGEKRVSHSWWTYKTYKRQYTWLKNVVVDSFEGLTIEYAQKHGADVLIRGLRAVSDFEYEMQLSQTNSALCDKVKTVFLTTKPKYNFISSSTIKKFLLTEEIFQNSFLNRYTII